MAAKEKSLSTILGLYVIVPILLFSSGLLYWSYNTARQALRREIESSFEQRKIIAENALESTLKIIERELLLVRKDPSLGLALLDNDPISAKSALVRLDESLEELYLDILFISKTEKPVWSDGSSPFYDPSLLLPQVAALGNDLVARARIIRQRVGGSDLTMLLRASPIINKEDGNPLGLLIGGVVLNDNLSLLNEIIQRTNLKSVMLFHGHDAVASSNPRLNSVLLQGLKKAELEKRGAKVHIAELPDGDLAGYLPLSLQGRAAGVNMAAVARKNLIQDIKRAYLVKTATVFLFSLLLITFAALLVRRMMVPPLENLLAYSKILDSDDKIGPFKPGRIKEFNQLGAILEQSVDKLQRSQRLVNNIINSMPSSLVAVNEHGQVIAWNLEAERKTGVAPDKAKGENLEKVFPALSMDMVRVRQAIRTRSSMVNSKVPRTFDGETRFEDITIYPLIANGIEGAVVRVDDVTERVRLEEMLVQSEKMISVGGLAAGMAHEINNPLAAVLGNAQVIKQRLSSKLAKNRAVAEECGTDIVKIEDYMGKRGVLGMISAIHEAGGRAAKIVSNMLSFSRKGETNFTPCDLADVMDQTVELAATKYDLNRRYDFKKIQVVRDYDPGRSLVKCEKVKIQQVFLNLLVNASEAMAEKDYPENDTPRFILRVKEEEETMRVEIEDNGPGIDAAGQKRAFEPFYTTKPVGRGTGLGLSVSYFIIAEEHGGRIDLESRPGEWTRFTIRLPKGERAPRLKDV